ncbi:MAG: ATP-grasp domain-containing protein [Eubacterium sp.]|nr:ATP-grasp domain-containing protein [Eubacterium sp.]
MRKKIMIISSSLDGRLLTGVETAGELGMETVACVREEDDPAAAHADRAYKADGNDTERLLEIAKKEEIDGVLGVWDKSALSAAIIAEELGLPGNSPECVKRLLEKGSFRKLQKDIGVFCPEYYETDRPDGLAEKCAGFHYPLIVKPVLCSSSFGQTKIYKEGELIPAFEKATAYSRNGMVCVEEFIEHDSLQALEAEIFLVGDDILWDGLCRCWRFPEAPLRPVLTSYPVDLDDSQEAEFKSAVKKVLSASGARIGEFDVEGFFTEEGRFFIIEINPRPAGYYAQQDVQLFCGVDYTKLLVTTAVGDMSYYEELKSFRRQKRFLLSYAVFSFAAGIFDHLYIDPSIRDNLLVFRAFPGGEPGTYIEDIHADNRPVGMAVFAFSSEEELDRAQENIRELVYTVLKDS